MSGRALNEAYRKHSNIARRSVDMKNLTNTDREGVAKQERQYHNTIHARRFSVKWILGYCQGRLTRDKRGYPERRWTSCLRHSVSVGSVNTRRKEVNEGNML